MAKSTQSSNKSKLSSATPSSTQPAQHIWLAGLGAMAKAQEEGTKAIEALVNDGLAFQRKSQAEAQQRLHEATEQLSQMATGLGQQTSGRIDRLEHLFEDRVAKALHRLGFPSLQDMEALSDRLASLEAWVQSQRPTTAAHSPPSTAPAPQSTALSDNSAAVLTIQNDKPARVAKKPSAKAPRKSARSSN